MVAVLEQQNIPIACRTAGPSWCLPTKVPGPPQTRFPKGLPRGGMVGFELMENQKFGISHCRTGQLSARPGGWNPGPHHHVHRRGQAAGSHLAIPNLGLRPRGAKAHHVGPGRPLPGRVLDAAQWSESPTWSPPACRNCPFRQRHRPRPGMAPLPVEEQAHRSRPRSRPRLKYVREVEGQRHRPHRRHPQTRSRP